MAVANDNPIVQLAIQRLRRRGQPLHGRVALSLMEALGVESNYQDLNYGDRDSSGPLQQRPSTGWGPASEGPGTDIDQYLERAIAANSGFKGSAGQLAQSIQRSAFPGRYDQRRSEALALLGSPQSSGASSRASIASSLGNVAGTSTDAPGTPSVFDTIRQYRENTQPRPLFGMGEPGASDIGTGFKSTYEGSNILDFAKGLADQRKPMTTTTDRPVTSGVSGIPAAGGASGKIKIVGGDPGRLKPGVTSFAEQLAGALGRTLTIDSGASHDKYTVNGNISEHYTGDATDIPMAGKQLLKAGQEALILAGMDPAEARKKTGGLFNVMAPDGTRYQIIFLTNEGGNHYDHLHVGVRPGKKK